MIEALQRHKRTSPDLVFSTKKGTPIEPRRYDKDFKTILQRAGLPQEIRLHSARHFGLSLLAALGVHPRVAMEIAGHSDLRTYDDDLQSYRLARDEAGNGSDTGGIRDYSDMTKKAK